MMRDHATDGLLAISIYIAGSVYLQVEVETSDSDTGHITISIRDTSYYTYLGSAVTDIMNMGMTVILIALYFCTR